jgi:cleavage and polyadenylation specificity factor subunit 2
LISHPDLEHVGGLPFVVSRMDLDCPIYATVPVKRLGQVSLYEWILGLSAHSQELLPYSLDDIDLCFGKVIALKWSQETRLSGKGEGIVVTPFPAGHSLGGAFWKIQKETDEIAYAVQFNHRREAHLNGAVLEAAFNKPSVMITDLSCFNGMPSVSRKDRDQRLFQVILETFQQGGHVMIPIDGPGSRTLEILYLLNQFWEIEKLSSKHPLILLAHTGFHIVEYAKSFIEWMSTKLQNYFDQNRDNPFSLRNVKFLYNFEEAEQMMNRAPCVILCTGSSVQNGLAESVFLRVAGEQASSIVFPTLPESNTLASKILTASNSSSISSRQISFLRRFQIPLEGAELDSFLEEKRREMLAIKEEDSLVESDSEDEAEEAAETVQIFKRRAKLTPSFPMFTAKEASGVLDDYGQPVQIHGFQTDARDREAAMEVDEIEEPEPIQVFHEDQEETIQIPTKDASEYLQVFVQCQTCFIDFEGIVDSRSLKTILNHISPRKLVVLRGDESAKLEIKEEFEGKASEAVFFGRNKKTVGLTSDASTLKVRLRDAFSQTLDIARVGTGADFYEVAYIEGKMSTNAADLGIPVIDRIPEDQVSGHSAIFLGNVKLFDVRRTLIRNGIDAEFVGGTLVCHDGLVNIRKASDTAIAIRGALSEQYFRIRELLYGHFQIV